MPHASELGADLRALAVQPIGHLLAVRGGTWKYLALRLAEVQRVLTFLLCSTPYTPETHQVINASAIAAMKSSAVVINVGRGRCIDEAALTAGEDARPALSCTAAPMRCLRSGAVHLELLVNCARSAYAQHAADTHARQSLLTPSSQVYFIGTAHPARCDLAHRSACPPSLYYHTALACAAACCRTQGISSESC
jgi:hypothetical protein